MHKNNKETMILPSIMMRMREEHGLCQQDVVDILYEKSQIKLSKSNVSLWECGRRPVPFYLHQPIADIFGVTTAYLYGITDDPQGEPEQRVNNERVSDKLIPLGELHHYHGLPVYVAFPDKDKPDSWAIYDKVHHTLVFPDGIMELSHLDSVIMVYAMRPEYLCDYPIGVRRLHLSEAIKKDKVYIKMCTSNERVCNIYDGFYRNNENYSGFINSRGLALPYDGAGISYHIYSDYYCV